MHTKKRCLENFQRKTAAEALIDMSGAKSLIQNYTSTSTSNESVDSGRTGVSTQTDPVTSADVSTSISTQCVIHETIVTDMTGSYLETLYL